jgi:hypothetical protein
LTLKAAALAKTAPTQWREFLAELELYGAAKSRECVMAPPEVLQVTQGRAQQVASLVALFTDAVKDAERIVDRIERRSK